MISLHTHSVVMGAISLERVRQEKLKEAGRFTFTPDEVEPMWGSVMLSEECGEVARAALAVTGTAQETTSLQDLYAECIQTAAVAAAIAEGILNSKTATGATDATG